MSAFDEIVAIEARVQELRREIKAEEPRMWLAKANVKRDLKKVETARKNLEICRKNLHHMRTVADHVVIGEWIAQKNAYEDAKHDLMLSQVAHAAESSRKRSSETRIKNMEIEVLCLTEALKKYGSLIEYSKISA